MRISLDDPELAKPGELSALPRESQREFKNWNAGARFTVARKGETQCRNCGAKPDGKGVFGSLHLHHVIPRSMCKAIQTELLNGIPLCFGCHSGWHERRVTIYRDVFTAAEWEFLSNVKLLGQNVIVWLDMHYPSRP